MSSWGALCIGAAFLTCAPHAAAQHAIRQVDFRNFTYPLRGEVLGHSNLQWLSASSGHSLRRPIHLRGGNALTTDEGGVYGFKLVSITYGDLNGDAQDEAVVDVHYDTGGTQQTDYVYIYTLRNGKPELLAFCHTGDRASSGLHKVYVRQQKLVFELFDLKHAEGDCCSTGLVITTYAWRNSRFVLAAPVQRRVDSRLIEEYSATGDTRLR